MTPNTALLLTIGLGLRAAGRDLLIDLDWQVLPGQRWCVIGPNAAGKSTLLRALAGLSVPQRSGQVHWLGRPQAEWAAADSACLRAFAPQHPVDRFPIRVDRLLALSGVQPGSLTADHVLADLDSAALAQRGVRELSGGERQRIALAQCALQGAPLMLMDEPVSFQDPAHQMRVSRWLAGLVPPGAATALVITAHDVNWIARTATHVLAMTGQGGWHAGPVESMLNADLLAQVYGCAWRAVGGVWIAE